jgi:hypothetical protein
MPVLASDIVNAGLRLSGVMMAPGRGGSPEEKTESLAILGDIIDQWNAQRYFVLSIDRKLFPLVAGQQHYTIGPSATDFVIDRPPKIEDASLVTTAGLEFPIEMVTFDQWQLITLKTTQSTYPTMAWYNPAQEYLPNARLSVWPVPNVTNSIALYGWSQMTAPALITTPLLLGPGYRRALQYELAVELCIRWRRPVPQDVRMAQMEATAKVKSLNAPTLDLRCDEGLLPGGRNWNWQTGGY